MKILMVQGKEIMVDDDVYMWAKHFKWQLGNKGHVYIHQNRSYAWLHRIIMDTPEDMLCDHKDRNPSNNTRENLRNCTKSQNSMNTTALPNKLGYRGVSVDKRRISKPYRAYIQVDGKRKSVGSYATPEEAGRGYDKAAKEHYGEYAILNFPDS